MVSTFLQELPVDENRAWIDSDIRIGSGNSGGASINTAGELVGINTAVVTEATVADSGEGGSFTGGSARIRPVNFAQDLIEIAEDGGDPDYVSPLLEEMPAPPTEMPAAAQVVSAGWTGDGQGGCTGSSSVDTPQEYAVPNAGQVIYAEFAVTGIEDGTPVNFDFYALDGQTLLSSGEQVWDFGRPSCASSSRSRCRRARTGPTRSSGSATRCSPRTRWCSSTRSRSLRGIGALGRPLLT